MQLLCIALNVHRSGYYAWLHEPLSRRAQEDASLEGMKKQCWIESGGYHGYRNLYIDMIDIKSYYGRDRVLRLMRQECIKARRGYKVPRGYYGGSPDHVADNLLNHEFNVTEPNQWWVTDITYIKTYEGFLFLAVLMDLAARNIVGWSMSDRMTEDLAMNAITAAYWRRKPKDKCIYILIKVHNTQVANSENYSVHTTLSLA